MRVVFFKTKSQIYTRHLLRDHGITHHVSRIHGCVVLEKATRNSFPQWRNLTRRPVLSYFVDRSTSEQAVMQTFVRKTFLLSPVKIKQTQRRQMRGQDRPMPLWCVGRPARCRR